MNRTYGSFEEIDKQLKILKLQRNIHSEQLKLNLSKTKSDLSPKQLLLGFKGTLQQMVLGFAIQQLTTLFRNRK